MPGWCIKEAAADGKEAVEKSDTARSENTSDQCEAE